MGTSVDDYLRKCGPYSSDSPDFCLGKSAHLCSAAHIYIESKVQLESRPDVFWFLLWLSECGLKVPCKCTHSFSNGEQLDGKSTELSNPFAVYLVINCNNKKCLILKNAEPFLKTFNLVMKANPDPRSALLTSSIGDPTSSP